MFFTKNYNKKGISYTPLIATCLILEITILVFWRLTVIKYILFQILAYSKKMKKCQIEYFKEKNVMINYLFFSIMIFMNIIGYCYTRKGNFYNLYLSFIRIVCYLFHYKLQS